MSVGAFFVGRGEGDWEAAFLACFFWGGGDGEVACLASFFGGGGGGEGTCLTYQELKPFALLL